MAISSKRAEILAWVSFFLSIVFFLIAFFMGRWSGISSVTSASWLILSAVFVWLVLGLQFHLRRLAEQERLDMSQIEKSRGGSTIFAAKEEQEALMAGAQRRLATFEKWAVPVLAALIAVYQLVLGAIILRTIEPFSEVQGALIAAIGMTSVAFLSFLISRYATGMSSQLNWKPLRAGGSMFLAVAVICFTLAISLAFAQFNKFLGLNILAWAIPIILIVIGVETSLNTVFDIYRPRIKGQYSRASFDSRLLGIINEPGAIVHTAASAIDYQFGFKVSQTWFYKLLSKAIVPLILFGALVLYLLSAVTIVGADEEAVVEHFGNPVKNESGQIEVLDSGLHFKWPWPIEIVYKLPTKKVKEIAIGYIPETDPKTGEVLHMKPKLWGQSHYKEEFQLLVASREGGTQSEAVPVSTVMVAIPVQYRIKSLPDFLYKHRDSEQRLEEICYQQLTRFAANTTIEVDGVELERSLLGAGRSDAKEILTQNIQAAADKAGLGIEVVFLGLAGIHPPTEVAADYQQVVGSVQKKQALILGAQAERNMVLSFMAGSVDGAQYLYLLADKYQKAKDRGDNEQIEMLASELDKAFADAQGIIFKTLREAKSYAFERVESSKGTGERFAGQVKANQASEELYKQQQRLAALEEALENIRKYVVVPGSDESQVYIVDMQEKLTPSLYDISGIEETK
ncbi:MAG: SPFH domain-containing protein [Phycisphaerae bacterium]|nr:SPFH domain-containing protein [Phycisphaerae bacterium]